MPRTSLTLGAPESAATIGYVTWFSITSGLRSQREAMMTWVSPRSGIASRGIPRALHRPAATPIKVNKRTVAGLRADQPMTRLTMANAAGAFELRNRAGRPRKRPPFDREQGRLESQFGRRQARLC